MTTHLTVLASLGAAILLSPEILILGLIMASDRKAPKLVAWMYALGAALGKLFALSEAYPDLKANTNFLQLQQELSMIEDKLAAAYRFYNSAVQDYNTAREQFPGSIIAGSFNFEARDFFDVGAERRAAMDEPPKVGF